jgi:hypothetical protein
MGCASSHAATEPSQVHGCSRTVGRWPWEAQRGMGSSSRGCGDQQQVQAATAGAVQWQCWSGRVGANQGRDCRSEWCGACSCCSSSGARQGVREEDGVIAARYQSVGSRNLLCPARFTKLAWKQLSNGAAAQPTNRAAEAAGGAAKSRSGACVVFVFVAVCSACGQTVLCVVRAVLCCTALGVCVVRA